MQPVFLLSPSLEKRAAQCFAQVRKGLVKQLG